jgi:hypothetical protein
MYQGQCNYLFGRLVITSSQPNGTCTREASLRMAYVQSVSVLKKQRSRSLELPRGAGRVVGGVETITKVCL